MKNPWVPSLAPPLILTALLSTLLTALWMGQRWFTDPPTDSSAAPFAAWISLLFLLATVATIVWASTAEKTSGPVTARRFLGYAILTDSCGALLFTVGISEGFLRLMDVVRVYILLLLWLGLWTSIPLTLRKIGQVFSVVVSLTIAMLIFALPVIGAPLVKVVVAWMPEMADATEKALATLTPMLAVLDGVRGSSAAHEPTLAKIKSLPQWWMTASLYATIALILWALRRPWHRHPTQP